MKRMIVLSSVALSTMLLLSGCLVIGNRGVPGNGSGTVGQQLIDLQKAHSTGVITDAEYQTLKAKALGNK